MKFPLSHRVPCSVFAIGLALALAPLIGYSGARFARSEPTAGQPVVADRSTGLIWQGCVAGLSGSDCTDGTASALDWVAAGSYCETLDWGGWTDWFFPDVKQLGSIVDNRKGNPAIDTQAFPQTPTDMYWSSSPSAEDSNTFAWLIFFDYGSIFTDSRGCMLRVRCARLGS